MKENLVLPSRQPLVMHERDTSARPACGPGESVRREPRCSLFFALATLGFSKAWRWCPMGVSLLGRWGRDAYLLTSQRRIRGTRRLPLDGLIPATGALPKEHFAAALVCSKIVARTARTLDTCAMPQKSHEGRYARSSVAYGIRLAGQETKTARSRIAQSHATPAVVVVSKAALSS